MFIINRTISIVRIYFRDTILSVNRQQGDAMPVHVQREGILFKKTTVHHNGGETVYHGDVEVTIGESGTCVKERGFFTDTETCYLNDPPKGDGGSRLPDGEIVGSSKSVILTGKNGEVQEIAGTAFSPVSIRKEAGELVVEGAGFFGRKELARVPASEVAGVTSEDCSLCRAVNPLYK